MKCTLNPGIKNISGKFGGMIFRTFTRPDGPKNTLTVGSPWRWKRRKEANKSQTVRKPYANRT